jgi:hypothetical protein
MSKKLNLCSSVISALEMSGHAGEFTHLTGHAPFVLRESVKMLVFRGKDSLSPNEDV